MTTIHAQYFGDQAILPRSELERLLELARQTADVEQQFDDSEITTESTMSLAENGEAFGFWNDEGENIYSVNDGEPL